MSAVPAQPDQKEAAQLAKGAGIAFVGKFAGRGVNILTQILLATLLSTEKFGLYGLGLTLLLICGLLASLGLHLAVVRFGSRYWKQDAEKLHWLLRQSLGWAFLSGIVWGGLFYGTAPLLATAVFGKEALAPVLRGFAWAFPAFALLKVSAAATQIPKRVGQAVMTEDVVQPVVAFILWLGFYGLGGDLMAAVGAVVISYWVAAAVGVFFVYVGFQENRQTVPRPAFSIRELFVFSVPALFPGLFSIILLWSDRLFVGSLLTAQDAGIYQAVSQFSILFVLVMNSFGSILAPMTAAFQQQGARQQLRELFALSTRWGMTLTLPGLLIILFIPQTLLMAIFGADYAAGTLPLVILTVGQFINIATGPVGYLLIMTGHPHRWLVLSGLGVVLNTALNLWLIPQWGLTGAALATAISTACTYGAGLWQLYRLLQLSPYDRRYLKTGGTALLTAIGLFFLRGWVRAGISSPLFQLLILVALTTLLFIAILLLLGLGEEDKTILKLIQKRLNLNHKQ